MHADGDSLKEEVCFLAGRFGGVTKGVKITELWIISEKWHVTRGKVT